MKHWIVAALALMVTGRASGAQQFQAEVHGNYARTTQTHANAWGAGAQLASTWGAKRAPAQLVTSLAGDWQAQENNGPTQWTLGYDATVQPGGQRMLTPYAGGSISANWLSGGGAPSGAQLGLQYILGVLLKPEAQGPLTLKLELRPGYVKTQEHSVTGRFGVDWSM
jgi:hypothetical protein